MNLPEEYIVQKFYQYTGSPTYNRHTHTYQGCCPVCREGKSWGKKKRLFYLPEKGHFYCHNCSRSWSPVNWIVEVTGLSVKDILQEASNFDIIPTTIESDKKEKKVAVESLPKDSINLFNEQQLSYYNNDPIVQLCLNEIKRRRLNTAINKPKALYISLTDYIHKNRLCIPFYDTKGKIVFYQTRALTKKDKNQSAKYLSKVNADKTVFGIDKIDIDKDNIFIFEGPIDSMFIKNGVAVGGIHLSEVQEKQLSKFPLLKKIWVLDNQKLDKASNEKTKKLLEQGETVFIWPVELKKFKDINDVCIEFKLNHITNKFVIKNSFEGIEGVLRLQKI